MTLTRAGAQGPGTRGALRAVRFVGWPVVMEEVVAHTPPTSFQYEVKSGMPHLAGHLGTLSVSASEAGARVRWQIRFDFRPWHPLSWCAPLFVAVFGWVVGSGLVELKRQLEAG